MILLVCHANKCVLELQNATLSRMCHAVMTFIILTRHSFVSPYGAPVCMQRGLQPFPTISAVNPNEYCGWQPIPGRLHDDGAEATV